MIRGALVVLSLATLCSGFAPVPSMLKPKLRHTITKVEPVSHCVANAEASRVALGYVAGTMIFLAISTVNDLIKAWLESSSRK